MEEIYLGKIYNKNTFIIFENLNDIDYLIVNFKSYLLIFVDNSFKTKSIYDLLASKNIVHVI